MSNYRFTTEYAIHVYVGGLMMLKVTKMAFAEPPSSDVATYCYCWSCFVRSWSSLPGDCRHTSTIRQNSSVVRRPRAPSSHYHVVPSISTNAKKVPFRN